MNKEGLEISLTNDLSEEIFFNALCNSMDYMCSSYGLDLRYKEADYKVLIPLLLDDPLWVKSQNRYSGTQHMS